MFQHLRKYPLFVLILMIGALSMFIPALYAAKLEQWLVMQTFLSFSLLILIVSTILGLAMMNRQPRNSTQSHLISVLMVYALFPIFLALPFVSLIPSIGPLQGYFEMLSSLTTTGATLIGDPLSISPPLHLWRALVAWMGGFLILIIALGIMEPMNLGGFEIRSKVSGATQGPHSFGASDPGDRIIKQVLSIGPVYVFVTFVLMTALYMSGDRAYVAAIHAMSIISTSGISPVGGVENATSGRLGEIIMFAFLFFAISNRSFQTVSLGRWRWIGKDVEVRLALIALIAVPSLLFMRHWIGAIEVETHENLDAAGRALWGSIFTVMSFLTTTGFESADWESSRGWSGLSTPGVVFLALAVMGGGVATTAGGVKLLRIYALYKHGLREMERLVHPSSVGGAGMAARRFRREGAFIAWIFLMLFLVGIAMVMLVLSFYGLSFEQSVAMSIAALTNTGPVAMMLDPTLRYSILNDTSLIALSIAMIFGRVEVLVLIALFNPNYWRR